MRGMFCVLLAIVARAHEVDVCHEASGDPSCGDSAAVSLLQKTVALDVAPRVRVPRGVPSDAPHFRVLSRENHEEEKGKGCCSTKCSSTRDCASGLFCCPHWKICMDRKTKSTHGPNCDSCNENRECVDSTTYKDPYFKKTCTEWAKYGCDGFPWTRELKNECPKACKVCTGGGGGGGGAAPAPAPPAPATPQEWVDAHNVYRCMHGVPLLKWNQVLADKSQAWVEKTDGAMKHSSSQYRKNVAGFSYVGENIAWASPDPPSAAQSVKMWYDEIQLTDGGLVSGFTHGTGHYTQVVWKASTDLGCGGYKGATLCQYGPGGNFGYSKDYKENVKAPVKTEAECKK